MVWRPRVCLAASDWPKLKTLISVAPHLQATPHHDVAAIVVQTQGHAGKL